MTEEQRDYKLKQFKELLNQALNEAMCYNKRIKNPNSNKIAEFVNDFMNRNHLSIICEGVSDWEKTFEERFESRHQFSGDAPTNKLAFNPKSKADVKITYDSDKLKVKKEFYCSQTGWNGITCSSQCEMCKK